MGLLPIAALDLESKLPPEVLLGHLRAAIGGHPGAPFAGEARPGRFRITRVNEYRTTFLPVVTGSILPAGGGSAVRLRMRPHASVLVFLAIWLAFLAVVTGLAVAWRLRSPANSALWLAGPALLAAVTWRIVSGVFSAEARWLVGHLQATIPALGGLELICPPDHL